VTDRAMRRDHVATFVEAGRGDGAVLRLHVRPGASADGVAGLHGKALKVKLRAPAVDGRANAALLRFLARVLGAPAGSLSLLAGERSRDKRVLVAGVTPGELSERLAAAVAGGAGE